MPDDTNTAIKALFGQIERLTGQLDLMQKSVDGTAAKNAELLAVNKALKEADSTAPSPKKQGLDAAKESKKAATQTHEEFMASLDKALGGDKQGKHALKWTRLSCMRLKANAVRLQLHALAYNLANFLRTLATPEAIERWSLTSLRERLIKTGARLVRHGRYAIFQMAEAALPRQVFASILALINGLRGPPSTAMSA
jgi:hypothetical protein